MNRTEDAGGAGAVGRCETSPGVAFTFKVRRSDAEGDSVVPDEVREVVGVIHLRDGSRLRELLVAAAQLHA